LRARLSSTFVVFWDDRVMAKGYRPVARDQALLLPPDMREWLPEGHPVWLVIAAVADYPRKIIHDHEIHVGCTSG
jgi:hypothetical protein